MSYLGTGYEAEFKKYYIDFFSGLSLPMLVAYEDNISRLIDSDLFDDCILQDEIIYIYDIIRDECVHRCEIMAETSI